VKRERYDRLRGRHKKAASLETRAWNRERLPPKIPCPSWMDEQTFKALQELRRQVDPWEGK